MTSTLESPPTETVQDQDSSVALPLGTIGIMLCVMGGAVASALPQGALLMVAIGSYLIITYGEFAPVSQRAKKVIGTIIALIVVAAMVAGAVLFVQHRAQERESAVGNDIMTYASLNESRFLYEDGYVQDLSELGAGSLSDYTDPDSVRYVRYGSDAFCIEAAIQDHPGDVLHYSTLTGSALGHCAPVRAAA